VIYVSRHLAHLSIRLNSDKHDRAISAAASSSSLTTLFKPEKIGMMAGILYFPIPSVLFFYFYSNKSVADMTVGPQKEQTNKPILSQFLNIHKLDSIPPCNVT
jgi:hypothetical protein